MTVKVRSRDEKVPKIEFPCDYPIKVIGHASEEFEAVVLAVFERHTGGVSPQNLKRQPSRKGNYISLTVTIEATGEQQISQIFLDLKAIASVKIVL
ncbi:MAG: DUF493 domain-containing protein [Gammaproteobacteria bacterium]|jgi:hypothetical protein|nr:hypothetical protein [Gammaproteobacteria bacterium]MDP6094606.1 DUF493 domain-containing protein [Gammaproteobacteria bacterium]|tara:strand:+ start:1163 stop:1450 length:288 start_codon:yes stop_codon:yes gene_type:complete